jgi:nitrate reductase NapAB chaperone NapD
MTLYEFNALEQQSKYDEVLNISVVYLDNHINGNQRFNLYAIDKFFVEIEYNITENKIVIFRAFKTGDLLDKYSSLNGIL